MALYTTTYRAIDHWLLLVVIGSEFMASKQFRNFATVLYTDSMPDNVFDLLADLHVPLAVSPLHDRDLREDGSQEFKKPHYHVLFCLDGKITETRAREMIRSFGGVGFEQVRSKKAYQRYLCHLDDFDKAQYNPSDIMLFGGLCLDLTSDGAQGIMDQVYALSVVIQQDNVHTPKALISALLARENYVLLEYVQKNAYFVRSFLL